MEKSLKRVFLFISILLFPLFADAHVASDSDSDFDWKPVVNAIMKVESNGNPNAVSGASVGALQITPLLVAECNNILRARKSKKRYKLKDRLNVAKSIEMFLLIQSLL